MSKFTVKKSEGGGDFKPLDAGTYLARCYAVIVTGTHDAEYQGRKYKRSTVRIQWELPDEKEDFGNGLEPRAIGKTYTNSLGGGSKPSALRGHLESWRGRPFTEEEQNGFDVDKLLGVPCVLTVSHVQKQDGSGVYAAIASVGKLMKGQTCPPAITKPVLYHVSELEGGAFHALPDWLQEEIKKSDEWKAEMAKPAKHETPAVQSVDPEDAPPADDIPF